MTVKLAAVPVFLCAGQEWVEINAIWHDYDEYCGLRASPVPVNGVYLDSLFEQDLSWAQAGSPLKYLRRAQVLLEH